jgi:hypothetical protein
MALQKWLSSFLGGTDPTSEPRLSALCFKFNQHYVDINITKQSTAHWGSNHLCSAFLGGSSWLTSIIPSNPTYFALLPCSNNRIFHVLHIS